MILNSRVDSKYCAYPKTASTRFFLAKETYARIWKRESRQIMPEKSQYFVLPNQTSNEILLF